MESLYGDGGNLYGYLKGNPYKYSDVLGLSTDPFDEMDAILAEMAGARSSLLKSMGKQAQGAAIVTSYILSYMPIPGVSLIGELGLAAMGEQGWGETLAWGAAGLIPGGKYAGKLLGFLGRAGQSAWQAAKHYAGKAVGWLRYKADDLISKAQDWLRRKPSAACGCFVAGTMVWTASGHVPIDQVQVGDLVWSQDEDGSGGYSLSVVTDVIKIYGTAPIVLAIEHACGVREEIGTTDEHPFYVNGEWHRADNIGVGDVIKTLRGSAVVLGVQFGSEREIVYNLSVAHTRTYLIGKQKVWVHNTNPGECFAGAGNPKAVLEYIRKNGKKPDGFKGGRTFKNYEGRLDSHTSSGSPIRYKEYDIYPTHANGGPPHRGAERIVIGSDGRAWYTDDHYYTFSPLP